ncbi:MAG: ATP synthase subunit I [Sulfuricella sp.]|nr:ATP synthase subunit I [Sulfuricella sp.]
MQLGAAYRVVGAQSVSIIVGASTLYFWQGSDAAVAAFFGGAAAVANALILVVGLRTGAERTGQDARQEFAWLVRSSMERFFMVALLIAAGLGWLKLMPVPLVVGFVLGQLALVVSTIFSGIEK